MSSRNKKKILSKYFNAFCTLPWVEGSIPGNIVENIISLVNNATILNTYDFVDAVIENDKGWQIKSTKSDTPVTWKRAKIENKTKLIEESYASQDGLQRLGNELIRFCNNHAQESIQKYNLNSIDYARCIIFPDGRVKYFERELCSSNNPIIFPEDSFIWHWSNQKMSIKKEQLSALHGFDKKTNKKMWAWHGLGENQLHFSGESNWWDSSDNSFSLEIKPSKVKLSYDKFFEIISKEL